MVKSASERAKAAYAKLRDLVTGRFSEKRTANAEGALADYEKKPKVYQAALEDNLREADADRDSDLMGAARALLELVQEQGPASGKYSVKIDGSEGIIVGDHATQTNTFGARALIKAGASSFAITPPDSCHPRKLGAQVPW